MTKNLFFMLVIISIIGFLGCSVDLDYNAGELINNGWKPYKPVTYYVDSQDGNDSNTGLSQNQAWRSLEKVDNTKLYPGDSVRFKRGVEFTGTLYINNSGNTDNYITVTDYGNPALSAPSFNNPEFDPEANNFGNCVRLQGSYILLENIYCHHSVAELQPDYGWFEIIWELGAIHIERSSTHCIVRNNELYDCGVGIKSYGEYALIENNYVHDCNRILAQWNWGPIGIWLGADHQEVSHNRIFNYSVVDPRIYWGPDAYGGGADGGAMEIDDARNPKADISIHHKYSRACQGFLEVTWSDVLSSPTYVDFQIHHNVSDDYQQFVAMWRGANCRIENNTIIRRKRNVNDWGVFNITQGGGKNFVKNNIVVVENDIVIFNFGKNGTAQPQNIVENNLFYAASGALEIGRDGAGQSPVIADPLFANYQRGLEASDFSITAGSPARNKGLDLGYKVDFTGISIPQGDAPDIGAFEYK
jgi:hypothetical protein